MKQDFRRALSAENERKQKRVLQSHQVTARYGIERYGNGGENCENQYVAQIIFQVERAYFAYYIA